METSFKPCPQHDFLRSVENVIFKNFLDTSGVWVLVCPAIFMDVVVNCNHIAMAIVIAIDIHWQNVMPLNFVADVIATFNCYIFCVADGRPLWQLLWLHLFSKWQVLLPNVADGTTTWGGLFYSEFWGAKQNLIPHVRQMVFAYVFI